MGIAEELLARGQLGAKVSAFVEKRHAFDAQFADIGMDDTPYPFLLFVSQAETERLLDEYLAKLGGQVERPVELIGFTQDDKSVHARLRHGDGREELVRARYIVGCDGAHSAVRKAAGLQFEGARYEQDFVLADVHVDWENSSDRFYFFFAREGLLVFFPLDRKSLYRLIASRTADVPADAGDPTLEEFTDLARRFCPVPVTLRDPRWLARFRLHHRGVGRYRKGRAFVAGDATHIHSPAGGQGMNTGIQDAYNLAWKLALVIEGRARDEFLDSYHAERHPVGRALLQTTDRMFSAMTSRNPLFIAARNFLLPRIAPWILSTSDRRARVFRFISQLRISYPDSPIVEQDTGSSDADFRRGPRAGARAPDAPVTLASDGSETSLFACLSGPSHALLVFAGKLERSWEALEASANEAIAGYGRLVGAHFILGRAPERSGAPDRVYVDGSGMAHDRYGLKGAGVYLIRPDGYIAFRSEGSDFHALQGYLRRTFLPS
jgi:2-polyprenyl-6-methoxyphenol hydroxylase-like FAD-dependent oxidoreductase